MAQKIIYGAAAIICLVLLYFSVTWAINNIESYEQEEKSGLSARARRNDFLAADYFLNQSGIQVESVSGRSILYQLPPTDDTLLISDIGIELSDKRQQSIEDWLNKGGHIVTTIPKLMGSSENNILQQMFTIEGVVSNQDSDEDSEENVNGNENLQLEVAFEDINQPLNISINPQYSLKYDEEFFSDAATISSEKGIQLVQLNIGDGRITVISDIEFLMNDNIGLNDHAYFIWLLVNERQKLWLLYSNNTPALWVRAWKFNPYLMISCLFLCLLFFWSLWHRFGPLEKDPDLTRRDIMEQLSAVGRFHMKTDKAINLLNDNRKSIHQAILKKHPVLKNMNSSDELEWLSSRVGVDTHAVNAALNDPQNNDMSLVQITRVLQRINKNI